MRAARGAMIALTLALVIPQSPSFAVAPTAKPTAKPDATVKKAITKTPAKTPAKTPKKAAAKPLHKSVVHHYYYRPRPRIGVAPSPAPHWPPLGYVSAGGVYARIPTGEELVSILSESKDPAAIVNQCAPDPKNPNLQAVACGAILAASQNGCSWWEVNSTLMGPDPATPTNIIQLGTLRTLAAGSPAHSISTIILVSGVPLGNSMKFTNISAKCWLTQTAELVPSDLFTSSLPLPDPAPTPSNP